MKIVTSSSLGLAVVCLVIWGSHGFQARGRAKVQDGKCKADDGSLYARGEKWYNDESCIEIRCGGRKQDFYVFITGCGSESYPDECIMVPGVGHFPDCCPQPICDFSDTQSGRMRRDDSLAFGGKKKRQLDQATLGAGAFGKWLKKRV